MKTEENRMETRWVEEAYHRFREPLLRYLRSRLDDADEAEDMVQDAFLRLMDYRQMLCEETMESFLFTIARNLLNDYLRRFYKWQEISMYLCEHTPTADLHVESRIVARDLAACERLRVGQLPPQRCAIYRLSRYEAMSTEEIADRMQLSKRTVENHLCIGRKEVRDYLRRCM